VTRERALVAAQWTFFTVSTTVIIGPILSVFLCRNFQIPEWLP
jgi:hypothetical protein